jgi:hypothetical protein
MNLPILLKQETMPLPCLKTNAARLILAGNGMFLERRGEMFSTSTRVLASDLQLDDHSQYCRLSCGKLPSELHRMMLTFFLHAHRMHGGEAALVLLFDPEQRCFLWHCPPQTIDVRQDRQGWYVDDIIEFENPLDLPDGYVQLGDAHLHPGSPHPSALDRHDDQDGLHIIVGDIARAPRYHIDFVMDGVRFQVSPAQFFADPDTFPDACAPKQWIEQIRIRAHGNVDADEDRCDPH